MNPTASSPEVQQAWLQLRLTADVLAPARGGTIRQIESLETVPGAHLLGAIAGTWASTGKLCHLLDGSVCWGDGLPVRPGDSEPALPLPRSYHGLPTHEAGRRQIVNGIVVGAAGVAGAKPLRHGWLAATRGDETSADWLHVPLRLALKSQYRGGHHATDDDSDKAALFQYRSIASGLTFLHRITVTTPTFLDLAINPLLEAAKAQRLRLGRSRATEYGGCPVATRVSHDKEPQLPLLRETKDIPGRWAAFYCVSDLALLDAATGAPTSQPTPETFGLATDKWRWRPEKSFLSVRRYSPWNAFYGGWQSERAVITRGSVLVFEHIGPNRPVDDLNVVRTRLAAGVGEYRAEGLGWVALNPEIVWRPPFELVERAWPEKTPPASASTTETLAQHPMAAWMNNSR